MNTPDTIHTLSATLAEIDADRGLMAWSYDELAVKLAAALNPETGPHTAEAIALAHGFLIRCPHGCDLGTSAYREDREGANRRVELHTIATTPLGSPA